jgi:hypothetical protein
VCLQQHTNSLTCQLKSIKLQWVYLLCADQAGWFQILFFRRMVVPQCVLAELRWLALLQRTVDDDWFFISVELSELQPTMCELRTPKCELRSVVWDLMTIPLQSAKRVSRWRSLSTTTSDGCHLQVGFLTGMRCELRTAALRRSPNCGDLRTAISDLRAMSWIPVSLSGKVFHQCEFVNWLRWNSDCKLRSLRWDSDCKLRSLLGFGR